MGLMTMTELAKATGISRATLYRMKAEGLPGRECVGKRRYDLDEVKAFVANRERTGWSSAPMTEGETYTNLDIMSCFKVGPRGSIRTSSTCDIVVIISNAEDPFSEYPTEDFF